MHNAEARSLLFFALDHYGLEITGTTDTRVNIVGGYTVEIEGTSLYKLLSDGAVVAPFDEVDELCQFIKADQSLHG